MARESASVSLAAIHQQVHSSPSTGQQPRAQWRGMLTVVRESNINTCQCVENEPGLWRQREVKGEGLRVFVKVASGVQHEGELLRRGELPTRDHLTQ